MSCHSFQFSATMSQDQEGSNNPVKSHFIWAYSRISSVFQPNMRLTIVFEAFFACLFAILAIFLYYFLTQFQGFFKGNSHLFVLIIAYSLYGS